MTEAGQSTKPVPVPWWGWVLIVVGALVFLPFLDFGDEELEPRAGAASSEDSEPAREPAPEPAPEPFAWPTFEPLEIVGNSDDVVIFDSAVDFYAAIQVDANQGERYFGLRPVFANGETGSSYINTTDAFGGTVLLDGSQSEPVAGFEVQASGDWTLNVVSISEVPKLETGNTFLGSGAGLLRIDETVGLTTLDVMGNADSRYFGIRPHGVRATSLVNTTDPYDGTVRVPAGIVLLEVNATGDWAMTLN